MFSSREGVSHFWHMVTWLQTGTRKGVAWLQGCSAVPAKCELSHILLVSAWTSARPASEAGVVVNFVLFPLATRDSGYLDYWTCSWGWVWHTDPPGPYVKLSGWPRIWLRAVASLTLSYTKGVSQHVLTSGFAFPEKGKQGGGDSGTLLYAMAPVCKDAQNYHLAYYW